MTPGEPLEKTKDAGCDPVDDALSDIRHSRADRDGDAMLSDTADLLSQTMEGVGPEQDDVEDDRPSLDEEVRSLLNAIAEEESEHDETWAEVARTEDAVEDDDETPGDTPCPMAKEDDAHAIGMPPEAADATPRDAVAPRADDADASDAEATPPQADDTPEGPGPDVRETGALDALRERFETAEARNDQAMDRIGHALGMIATRIDGLEARATDRTIADLAFAAAPPDDDDEEDQSVAPYIARAEKELKAKKESGSMDIFDRIARAAETEFDDQAGSRETRTVADASDGRRVGTKRWQPSKAVKKRMAELEKARTGGAAEERSETHRTVPAPDDTHMEAGEPPTARAAAAETSASAPREPDTAFEPQDDDAGLSVVPGARGRRRNRARKSSLDSDFENVFAEEGDKPSIQSLRRKMRERPVEAPEESRSKGGMLGGILGKKTSKKAEPVAERKADTEDDDLMTAFDVPEGAPSPEAPERPAAPKKSKKKAKPVDDDLDLDDDDEDEDEDWEDDETSATERRRKPLVYALIAVAAAAGFVVWKTFLA